jgi:hypothetical protein
LCGTSLVSKTADNEHTTAALGHSEPLSVEDAVGPPIPQLAQRPEEGTKVPSSVGRQHTGYVFPDNPSRPVALSDLKECKHKSPSGVVKPFAEARDREALAGGSSDQKVDWRIVPLLETSHVSAIGKAPSLLNYG